MPNDFENHSTSNENIEKESTKENKRSYLPNKKPPIGSLHWIFATIGILIGGALVFFLMQNTGMTANGVAEDEAVAQAHSLYEEMLISPSTAEWAPVEETETEYLGNDRYYTESYVDSQNANAVQAREEFEIWYEYDESEEEWFIEDWNITN